MLKLPHILPFLLLTSCAVRQPGPHTWRFADRTLMPPGVGSPNLPARTFTAPIAIPPNCLESDTLTIQRRRSRIVVTVHRDALLRQPAGWLADWIDRAVSQNCIPAARARCSPRAFWNRYPCPPAPPCACSAPRAATTSSNSPRQPPAGRQSRAQFRDRARRRPRHPDEGLRKGTSISVEMQAPANLIGVETAWYDLLAKPDGRGSTIVPTSARVTIGGQAEDRAAPAVNLFRFPPEVGYYRLFYKADQSEVFALAPTRAALPADPDTCGQPACFPIPHGVA